MIKHRKSIYALITLAVVFILSTAFCVSYAQWTDDFDSVGASVNVGRWEISGDRPQLPNSGVGYYDENGVYRDFEIDFGVVTYQAIFYLKSSCADQKIYIALDGEDYGSAYFINSDGTVKTDDGAFILIEVGYYQVTVIPSSSYGSAMILFEKMSFKPTDITYLRELL